MTASDVLLAVMALGVGCVLAWSSGVVARVLLFGSAMLVSAMLFLPGSQLTVFIGADAVNSLKRAVADTPWRLSDWLHVAIFAWLGFLVWLGRPDLRGWKAWSLLVVLAIAAELAQGLTPSREMRFDDVLLNLAGGMCGLLLAMGGLALTHVTRRWDRRARGR